MKTILTFLLIIALFVGAGWFLFVRETPMTPAPSDGQGLSSEESSEETETPYARTEKIGTSKNGNDLMAYQYGTGDTNVLFVGGIHGGYSWNTALVAYELIEYLETTPSAVPENVRVTVIPVVNPDGLEKVVGTAGVFSASDVIAGVDTTIGRFNANNVDLNRNFACDWNATATWQNKTVSGGTVAFSEPEAQALRAYVEANTPAAVVVWYASAGGVYSSNCHDGVLPKTEELTNIYADASGYTAHKVFDYYATTGDFTNWLASIRIPAISVLLTNHTSTEWSKNKAGIDAVLSHYAQ